MPITVSFTYSETTPESAEHGDHSDTGFYIPGMGKFSDRDPHIMADIQANPGDYEITGSLEDMIYDAQNLGIYEPSDSTVGPGCWFSSHPETEDYSTGADVSYSLHIQGKHRDNATTIKHIHSLLQG